MDSTLLALETSSSLCSVALLRHTSWGAQITSLEHEGGMQTHTERLLPMAHHLLGAAQLTPRDLGGIALGQGPGAFTGLRVACSLAQGLAWACTLPVIPIGSLHAIAAQIPAQRDQAVVIATDARMGEVYVAVYRCRVDQIEGRGEEALVTEGQAGAKDGKAGKKVGGRKDEIVGKQAGGGKDEVAGKQATAYKNKTLWEVLQPPILLAAVEVVPWITTYLPTWCARTGLRLTPLLGGDAWEVYVDQMPQLPSWIFHHTWPPHAREIAQLAYPAWLKGEGVSPEAVSPLYVRDRVAYTTVERLQGQGGNPRANSVITRKKRPQITLAAMQASDLEAVLQIEAEVQAFPWTRQNFVDALAAGYDTCVLRGPTSILGFCILMHVPDVSHLLVLAVARAWQRQGLGADLLNWCVERVGVHETQGLLLEVRPSNQPALAFYTQQGFLRVGIRQAYYSAADGKREDAWVMQKCLAENRGEEG